MGNRNKIKNMLAFVLLAVTAVLAVAVFSRYFSVKKKEALLSALPKNIDVSLQKIHYSEIRNGVKQWDLEAEKAELDKKRETVDLRRPRLTLYLQKEPRVLYVSGDRARYELKTRNVHLEGNVEGHGGGMTISTERVSIITAESKIHTNDHVRMTYGASSLEGDGMEVHTDSGTMTLRNNVSAVLAGELKAKR
jgi:LPS export ABC transporter protein LptC